MTESILERTVIFKGGKFQITYRKKNLVKCQDCSKPIDASQINHCTECDIPVAPSSRLQLIPTTYKNICKYCSESNLTRMRDMCTSCCSGFKGLIMQECPNFLCKYFFGKPFDKCAHCYPPNIFEMPRFKENTALDEKIQEEPQVVDDGSSSKITQYYSPRMNLKPFLSSLNAQLKKFKAKPKAKVSLKEKFKKLCF